MAKYDSRGFIAALDPGELFVFGSNKAGRHGAGAALQAAKHFGAEYGVGEGITGNCYAFPTLDEDLKRLQLHDLVASRNLLYSVAEAQPKLTFLLTKVGCGLAGFQEEEMRALFSHPKEYHAVVMPYRRRPANIILPEDWRSK